MNVNLAAAESFDPNTVTPGVAGFVVTACIAIAVILLLWDMNRRIRRSQFRFEVREKIARELAERDAAAAAGAEPEGEAGNVATDRRSDDAGDDRTRS